MSIIFTYYWPRFTYSVFKRWSRYYSLSYMCLDHCLIIWFTLNILTFILTLGWSMPITYGHIQLYFWASAWWIKKMIDLVNMILFSKSLRITVSFVRVQVHVYATIINKIIIAIMLLLLYDWLVYSLSIYYSIDDEKQNYHLPGEFL